MTVSTFIATVALMFGLIAFVGVHTTGAQELKRPREEGGKQIRVSIEIRISEGRKWIFPLAAFLLGFVGFS